ncbi:hypothetical protein CANINC_002979 [Pichia inconspicua]|uniref:Cell wall mannoprotein PIR1-like C-terminal domain-containing protein n=1 Tax=Pichia inconspicua TaxID=52247 RepID=A0A4T0X076_9ASCO|nr:hypothetical protein CANINC_002979 [[Candida] inconspicua]
MRLTTILKFTTLITTTYASEGYVPGDNYSTFTPADGYIDGATTEFAQSFGIAINPIISSVQLSSVTTDKNGHVVVTQIGDGQIQATTSTPPPALVTQIGDGQIQASTDIPRVPPPPLVTQIGDGQIQATTLITKTRSTEDDTGILTTKITKIVKAYVTVPGSECDSTTSQEETTTHTITPVDTVTDTITSLYLPTLEPATVYQKREIEETAMLTYQKRDDVPSTCKSDTALSMTLHNGVLKDASGRIGAIVSNRQFQFDGPPPQAGSLFAAGWSIFDGKLALGKSTTFYQCLSGNFYNLYDSKIGEQCSAVELDIVLFSDC